MTPKEEDAWWVPPLLIVCALCVVVGLGMAFYTDNGFWILLTIPGVIFLGG
jgi:hypothetical protein